MIESSKITQQHKKNKNNVTVFGIQVSINSIILFCLAFVSCFEFHTVRLPTVHNPLLKDIPRLRINPV